MGGMDDDRRHVCNLHMAAEPQTKSPGSRLMGTLTDVGQVANLQRRVSPPNSQVVLQNVSKFYGEVLGVNRVNLAIPPGITSLVGPNGSGKTTLMNLMTGLIRPTC